MRKSIFLTGPPGVGKSTVVQRVLERLGGANRQCIHGFYTEEIRQDDERIGFDVVTLSGQQGILARTQLQTKGAPTVGKYVVDVPSFERLAIPSIMQNPQSRVIIIDELGKMELFSSSFFPAVLQALDSPAVVFGTLPLPRYGRTIPQVEAVKSRPDVEVITVSRANRNDLVLQIAERLEAVLDTPVV